MGQAEKTFCWGLVSSLDTSLHLFIPFSSEDGVKLKKSNRVRRKPEEKHWKCLGKATRTPSPTGPAAQGPRQPGMEKRKNLRETLKNIRKARGKALQAKSRAGPAAQGPRQSGMEETSRKALEHLGKGAPGTVPRRPRGTGAQATGYRANLKKSISNLGKRAPGTVPRRPRGTGAQATGYGEKQKSYAKH